MDCFVSRFNNLNFFILDGTSNEFWSLLFQILECPIHKVLQLILQIPNCPIFGSPKYIFNQVPPTCTYLEVGDSVCIRAIQLTLDFLSIDLFWQLGLIKETIQL